MKEKKNPQTRLSVFCKLIFTRTLNLRNFMSWLHHKTPIITKQMRFTNKLCKHVILCLLSHIANTRPSYLISFLLNVFSYEWYHLKYWFIKRKMYYFHSHCEIFLPHFSIRHLTVRWLSSLSMLVCNKRLKSNWGQSCDKRHSEVNVLARKMT